MALTTLANTKWIFNNNLTLPSSTQTYSDLRFWAKSGCGDTQYTQLKISSTDVQYYDRGSGSWNWNIYRNGAWQQEFYKSIYILDGTDVTNSTLIAWFQANATQITFNISDLTNTVWRFSNSVNIPYFPYIPNAGLYGSKSFNLTFTSNSTNYSALNWWNDTDFYRMEMRYDNTDVTYAQIFENDAYKEIKITGGTDATDLFLINFLIENAQQITYKTFDLSTLQLSGGTHTIQVKARATSYRDSNFSNLVNYVVAQPSGGTVTLTVTEYRTEGADEFKVYDGRDNTGTLIYDETSELIGTRTLNCQSGYLYIEVIGLSTLYVYGVNTSDTISYQDAGSETGLEKMLFTVNANGTISMTINWDD